MFIEEMSEDSIFIMNVEIIQFDQKFSQNMFILFTFHICKFWRGEKKTKIQLMSL